jgi:hypothetical protein
MSLLLRLLGGGGTVIIETEFSSVGTSTADWFTATVLTTVGDSTCTCTVTGLSATVLPSVWNGAGSATVDGRTAIVLPSVWNASGSATVTADAATVIGVVWNAAGLATVLGEAEDAGTVVIPPIVPAPTTNASGGSFGSIAQASRRMQEYDQEDILAILHCWVRIK